MKQRNWCDGHLDLAYLAVNGRDLRQREVDPDVGCITLPVLRDAGVRWVFGTIFTEMGLDGPDRAHRYRDHDDLEGAERAGMLQLEWYERMEREGEITIVRCRDDLHRPGVPEPRVMILMEGADPIRSPDDVARWQARGLRMVGLSWANGSRYAGGNSDGRPLAPIGEAMIDALDAHGIIHDASHLSDAAFDGVLARAKGRVVATHSNCRALLDDRQRHLRDDQIRELTSRGGVIGLNLFSRFLALDRRATLGDCIAHVEHAAGLAGQTAVALGSDMDGGFGPQQLPMDLDHPSKLDVLASRLGEGGGWSDAEIDGFTHANWLRMLCETLP